MTFSLKDWYVALARIIDSLREIIIWEGFWWCHLGASSRGVKAGSKKDATCMEPKTQRNAEWAQYLYNGWSMIPNG